jgi:type VI secretion system protein ImpM
MNSTPPGWYGKIAALGDFASRRLSSEWISTCDAWLSTVISDARADLGSRWLDVYLSAPLLRFAWTPGVVDERWWFGLLMPSCDSVGRYFPLIVALPDGGPPATLAEATVLERWYADIGRVALATLDDGADSVDGLERSLVEVPSWRDGSSLSDARPEAAALFASLASLQSMPARSRGRSAWWPESGPPGFATLVDGLPDSGCFADLLAYRPHDDLSTVVGP